MICLLSSCMVMWRNVDIYGTILGRPRYNMSWRLIKGQRTPSNYKVSYELSSKFGDKTNHHYKVVKIILFSFFSEISTTTFIKSSMALLGYVRVYIYIYIGSNWSLNICMHRHTDTNVVFCNKVFVYWMQWYGHKCSFFTLNVNCVACISIN